MISVIMLTYNREVFVGRAIESILSQTFTDFEFIIIDNGSRDRSGVIADSYAEKDNRIRVIHREKGSIGAGRNTGLDAARGEYIAFVDDDDWCEADYLEFLYKSASENSADVSICGTNEKFLNKVSVMQPYSAVLELLQRKKYNSGFPTKLIHHKLFIQNRFNPNTKYDDIYLMPLILSEAVKIVYYGLPKYNVHRHNNNNSAWTTDHSLITFDILSEYLKVYRKRTEFLSNKFPGNRDVWRYFEWSFMISMVEKIERLQIGECRELGLSMINELRNNRETFIKCSYILDFEKEWVNRYVGD